MPAPAQFRQVDDKGAADHLCAQPLDQLDPGLGGAAGGQQVIHQQHLFARLQCVGMQFHHRLAIFQRIGLLNGRPRQFALFAYRDKAHGQLMRNRASQNEPPRLEAHHLVNPLAGIGVQQLVHRHPKAARIGKQRGHIAEHDPRMGKVGDGADVVFDGFSHGFSLISSLDSGGAAP